jgi:hypothetical protein
MDMRAHQVNNENPYSWYEELSKEQATDSADEIYCIFIPLLKLVKISNALFVSTFRKKKTLRAVLCWIRRGAGDKEERGERM